MWQKCGPSLIIVTWADTDSAVIVAVLADNVLDYLLDTPGAAIACPSACRYAWPVRLRRR